MARGADRGFNDWPESFPGLRTQAVDLHEGLDVARATHADFAAKVARTAAPLPRPLALCGWSMGGLVVLQAAVEVEPLSVILIEASPPLEVQGADPQADVVPGSFDPEKVYGPFPAGVRSRPESALARGERKRGISVPSLPCPSLVISGDEFSR